MDLWIRSQNKEQLLKVDNFLATYTFNVYGDCLITFHNVVLGSYTTKKRALEVLDEIHNLLQPKFILDTSSIKPSSNIYEENGYIFQNYSGDVMVQQLNTYVYEMPKE